MSIFRFKLFSVLIIFSLAAGPTTAIAQALGSLRGVVTLESSGKPVHGVIVTILQLKRSVESNDDGVYEFSGVPAGTYDVVAHLDRVPDVVQSVQVSAGATANADFQMRLRIVGEQVTISASGEGETSFNSIQSVTSLTSGEISEKNTQSLGDSGIRCAAASSGARPV